MSFFGASRVKSNNNSYYLQELPPNYCRHVWDVGNLPVVEFNVKFFDDALLYADSLGLDKRKIWEISLRHAEYEYSKGDFKKSIDEYIKTINCYEPSNVIQKFLEKSKLDYLIKYLEAIVHNIDFKIRDVEEHKNYTSLLMNCYIMQDNFDKLKEFIDKKGQYFTQDLIRTIIRVCLEAEKIEIALFIAKNLIGA